MTKSQVTKEIQSCEDANEQTFTVTLKSGGSVECRCNPKQTQLEAAYSQVTDRKSFERGDFISPREILSID